MFSNCFNNKLQSLYYFVKLCVLNKLVSKKSKQIIFVIFYLKPFLFYKITNQKEICKCALACPCVRVCEGGGGGGDEHT